MTDPTPTTTPELPDDPRDCCRAASTLLIDSDVEDAWLDALAIVAIASAAMDVETDIPQAHLRRLLMRAEDGLCAVDAQMKSIREIVRHGTGDHRKWDKHRAEFAKAVSEGREPPEFPYEPTGYEVRGAMIASEAAGKPLSDDEAIALLRAHGRRDAA